MQLWQIGKGRMQNEDILLASFWHITRNKRMKLESCYEFGAGKAQKWCVFVASNQASGVSSCAMVDAVNVDPLAQMVSTSHLHCKVTSPVRQEHWAQAIWEIYYKITVISSKTDSETAQDMPNFSFFLFLFSFFFGHNCGMQKFLGQGWNLPQQWQCQILNPLIHQGTPGHTYSQGKLTVDSVSSSDPPKTAQSTCPFLLEASIDYIASNPLSGC